MFFGVKKFTFLDLLNIIIISKFDTFQSSILEIKTPLAKKPKLIRILCEFNWRF